MKPSTQSAGTSNGFDPPHVEHLGDCLRRVAAVLVVERGDLGEVVVDEPEVVLDDRVVAEDHLAARDPGELAQAAHGVAPVVHGEDRERGVERRVGERQRLGVRTHDGRATRRTLPDHRGRRFDRDHRAVVGLVVAGARADVDDRGGVAEPGVDLGLDPRIRPARLRVRPADAVVTRRTSRQVAQERHHLDRGVGRFLALVPLRAAHPLARLVTVLDREHAERDRDRRCRATPG